MIPIARPLITDEDKRRVLEVLDSGQFVSGRWVAAFEAAFARYVGCAHAVATSSGTTALAVALETAGIGPGDRVVTTPFTFGATANAILYRGAVPVFADIDPRTYSLDPDAVDETVRRTPGVRALLPVHLYGLAYGMDRLLDTARAHGLTVIEDAAQAHGAVFRTQRAGSIGAAGIFSFYPSKNMTTGEGGMLTTDDAALAARARLLVHGGQREQYVYDVLGYNYRMTEIAAALGVGQLEHLDARNARRRAIAARLSAGLRDLPWLERPWEPDGSVHVYHQYTVRVLPGRPLTGTGGQAGQRDRLSRHLAALGIGTRVYYPVPLHRTPLYRAAGAPDARCLEAERAAAEVLSLPVHPSLSDAEVDRVVDAVRRFEPRE